MTVNHVLDLFLADEYEAGLQSHHADPEPTAEHHRWAGACALNLNRPVLAKTLFLRARAAGDPGALVGLATVYRVTGEHHLARQTLNTVRSDHLSPTDHALCCRHRRLTGPPGRRSAPHWRGS